KVGRVAARAVGFIERLAAHEDLLRGDRPRELRKPAAAGATAPLLSLARRSRRRRCALRRRRRLALLGRNQHERRRPSTGQKNSGGNARGCLHSLRPPMTNDVFGKNTTVLPRSLL